MFPFLQKSAFGGLQRFNWHGLWFVPSHWQLGKQSWPSFAYHQNGGYFPSSWLLVESNRKELIPFPLEIFAGWLPGVKCPPVYREKKCSAPQFQDGIPFPARKAPRSFQIGAKESHGSGYLYIPLRRIQSPAWPLQKMWSFWVLNRAQIRTDTFFFFWSQDTVARNPRPPR